MFVCAYVCQRITSYRHYLVVVFLSRRILPTNTSASHLLEFHLLYYDCSVECIPSRMTSLTTQCVPLTSTSSGLVDRAVYFNIQPGRSGAYHMQAYHITLYCIVGQESRGEREEGKQGEVLPMKSLCHTVIASRHVTSHHISNRNRNKSKTE